MTCRRKGSQMAVVVTGRWCPSFGPAEDLKRPLRAMSTSAVQEPHLVSTTVTNKVFETLTVHKLTMDE